MKSFLLVKKRRKNKEIRRKTMITDQIYSSAKIEKKVISVTKFQTLLNANSQMNQWNLFNPLKIYQKLIQSKKKAINNLLKESFLLEILQKKSQAKFLMEAKRNRKNSKKRNYKLYSILQN